MQKIASPRDLQGELELISATNRRGATREDIATSLRTLADRVAARHVSVGEALETVQWAKDGIMETMASMRASGATKSPEYRNLQRAIDRVVKALVELEGAAQLVGG